MKNLFKDITTSLRVTALLAILVCAIYPVVIWGLSQLAFAHQANGSLIESANGQMLGSELLGQNFTSARYFQPRPSSAGSGYDAANSSGSNLGPTSKKFINGTTKGTAVVSTAAGGAVTGGPDVVDFDGIKLRVLNYCEANGIPYRLMQGDKEADAKLFKTDKGEFDPVKLIAAFNTEANPLTIKPAGLIPGDAVTGSASGLDPHISPKNALLQAPRVARERKLTLEVVQAEVAKATARAQFGILGEDGVNVLKLNLALDALVTAP